MRRLVYVFIFLTTMVFAELLQESVLICPQFCLVNREAIRNYMTTGAPWCESHCAEKDYLGCGMFYYSLVYMKRAQLCVCLGSGGGFVPRIMRQAQRDLGLRDAKTILVDGNMGPWGRPKWLEASSFFRTNFPDIEIIIDTTENVARNEGKDWKIDYLHIDADHSYEGALQDFEDYKKLMAPHGIITFHDTRKKGPPCSKVINRIKKQGYEVVNFPELGAGFALIRPEKKNKKIR